MSRVLAIIFMILSFLVCKNDGFKKIAEQEQFRSWNIVGGDAVVTHYSNLTQINKENDSQLQLAWEFSTGDVLDEKII